MGETVTVRYLTIVRHAESSPASVGESDYGRILSDRGRVQCEELRAWASADTSLGRFGPTVALVSAAARTRETFRRSFDGTDFVEHVEFSELIYNGRRAVSAEDLLIDVAAIDPVTTSLLVIGHSPTVLELMYALSRELPPSLRKGRFALGGAYVIELPDDAPVGLDHYDVVASYLPG